MDATNQSVHVNVTSPDRSVTGTFDDARGLVLDLDDRKLVNHTEDGLAEQVIAVVRGAITGSTNAHSKQREQRYGPRPKSADDAAKKRLEGFRDQLSTVEVRVKSPQQWVGVAIRGGNDVKVAFRPGIITRRLVGANELARDLNSALESALRQYATKYMKLRLGRSV